MKTEHHKPPQVGQSTTSQRHHYWQQHINACHASGLTIKDYCLQHTLDRRAFHRWKHRLSTRVAKKSSVPPANRVELIPVTLTVSNTVTQAPQPIILSLGGCQLQLVPPIDENALKHVVQILQVLKLC